MWGTGDGSRETGDGSLSPFLENFANCQNEEKFSAALVPTKAYEWSIFGTMLNAQSIRASISGELSLY